jgi:hypothetical protein
LAFPKGRFPGFVEPLGRIGARPRNIWQINVALSRIPVPAKHRVNSLCELSAVRFVDIAGVYLEVMQLVAPRLFSTEPYLAIASLAVASAIYQICKCDLLRSLSVRKYSILGYVALKELSQAEIAVVGIL